MTLLCVLEHDRGELPEGALEALTIGRELADQMGAAMVALVIGNDASGMTETLGAYGASDVFAVTNDLLVDYGPDAWADVVVQIAGALAADAVMSVGTDRGNEVMAMVAARMDLPFVANCLSIDSIGDTWSMDRIQWGGSLLEAATLAAETKLITFGFHSTVATPADAAVEVSVTPFDVELDASVGATMIKDRQVLAAGVTLATAPVVCSGGRGVGSAEGFGIIEELANELSGAVGCSRAVTNLGWRNHADQVGQTGQRIAPEIYIASGVSGAIQHWVGAMASKRILAINTDPEANMVVKADYAIIGDLHKVVPAITEEIRKRKGA